MLQNGTGAGAAFNWSDTALGASAAWPHCLRLTVDIVLHCPLPMLLVWGAARVTVFNDAYAALAGAPHAPVPGGNVPPAWPAPLAAAREAFARAEGGEAAIEAGSMLRFMRTHGEEQLPCDLYFTPLKDERGQVLGVLCSVAAATAGAAAAAPALPDALRILVVEDNLDSQYLVCEMLKAFGHQADGVAHAEDALSLLGRGGFDVLFTDVSLPGMSGVELARLAMRSHPSLTVIFASGYGDTLLRHLEFPFLSLKKPYELEQLQAALANVAQQLRTRS